MAPIDVEWAAKVVELEAEIKNLKLRLLFVGFCFAFMNICYILELLK